MPARRHAHAEPATNNHLELLLVVGQGKAAGDYTIAPSRGQQGGVQLLLHARSGRSWLSLCVFLPQIIWCAAYTFCLAHGPALATPERHERHGLFTRLFFQVLSMYCTPKCTVTLRVAAARTTTPYSCLAGAVQALLAAGCTGVRPMGQVPVADVLHPCNGGESSRSGSSGGNGSSSSSAVTASAGHGEEVRVVGVVGELRGVGEVGEVGDMGEVFVTASAGQRVKVGLQGADRAQVVVAVGEQQERGQEQEDPGGDDHDHGECYYEPLQSNVLVLLLPLHGGDLSNAGEIHPHHQQQQQQVEVVVDVCLPHEYGLGSKAPWGWARLRHAVYRSCRTAAAAGAGCTAGTAGGEVLVLDERTLYSLQGSRERLEEYVRQLLRERQRT